MSAQLIESSEEALVPIKKPDPDSIPPPGGERLQYIPYSHLTTPRLLRETLLLSYEGTLDCPELTGARSAEVAGNPRPSDANG